MVVINGHPGEYFEIEVTRPCKVRILLMSCTFTKIRVGLEDPTVDIVRQSGGGFTAREKPDDDQS